MSGLSAWFEASDQSFVKSSTVSTISTSDYGNIANNALVSEWKDRNPQSTDNIKLLAETSDSRRPTYVDNGINNLPALSFDASVGNYLISRSNMPIAQSDPSYTYFMVVKVTSTPNNGVVIGQGPNVLGTSGEASGIYFTKSGGIKFWIHGPDATMANFSLKSAIHYWPFSG